MQGDSPWNPLIVKAPMPPWARRAAKELKLPPIKLRSSMRAIETEV